MVYRALIPVKSLAEAKSRLATHMTQEQRSRLVLTMLHHVLCTLQESGLLEQISVVSPDERVLTSVRAWGAQSLVEEHAGGVAFDEVAHGLAEKGGPGLGLVIELAHGCCKDAPPVGLDGRFTQ